MEAHSQAVASTGTEVAPPPVAHTARWAPNAYLINCLHAVQQPLRQFPAAVPLVESLAARAAQLADAVVDLVETGTTMRAAGLAVLENIMHTEAVLITNPHSAHAALMQQLTARIQVRVRRGPALCRVLPGALLPAALHELSTRWLPRSSLWLRAPRGFATGACLWLRGACSG